jgi:hypothetical protein
MNRIDLQAAGHEHKGVDMRIGVGIVGLLSLCILFPGTGGHGLGARAEGSSWKFPFRMSSFFSKHGTDVRTYTCDECGQQHPPDMECTQRVAISDCIVGRKRVYDCEVRCEYVSVPEVRYRLKTIWVTKEIPAPGCYPVCKITDGQNCYGEEHWDDYNKGTVCETHCRSIEPKVEKVDCKQCQFEKGETTIKVRYKTCVKVPYTVYRRVKRQVCVKIPCDEEVDVQIIRHECHDPDCKGCSSCNGAACSNCRGQGCGECAR